jgi:NADPH2:quinone reductase
MRAVLSKTIGGPDRLVLETLPDPVAGPGEVVIAVKAVGINFPDTLIIEDRYQFKPERPFAPGAEVAGVVETVGQGVTRPAVGERVIAVPGWGGLVEKLKVDARAVIPIPDDMDFETAAGLVMTYGTSLYALKDRAMLKSGERLLILGAAGGVGAAAIELGKAMGAKVTAAVSSTEKADFARDLGADAVVVYPAGPLNRDQAKTLSGEIRQACGGDGPDVVYDAVGGSYAEPVLRAMAWEGRYLVVGFPAGIPSIPLNLTLLKSIQIVGVFWGAAVMRDPKAHAANMAELMRLWKEQMIRPRINRTFPLDRAGDAIRALSDRSALGKIVVTV